MNMARAMRRVVGDEPEQHQSGADGGFAEHEVSDTGAAPRRAASPGGHRGQVQMNRATTPSSARPLVSRWEYSISVAVVGGAE